MSMVSSSRREVTFSRSFSEEAWKRSSSFWKSENENENEN